MADSKYGTGSGSGAGAGGAAGSGAGAGSAGGAGVVGQAGGAGHALKVKKADLTWQHGNAQIQAAHGAELTERARDLVRRALGELYQEAQGGAQASTTAHAVAANLSNTAQLNRLAAESAASEHSGLNQGGTSAES